LRGISFRLGLAQAASGTLSGGYTPFFGAWLAFRGLSPAEIGALLSAGMLLRVFVAPLTGIFADAHNDRRGMMIFLGLVMLLGYGLLGWAVWPLLIFAAAIPANIASGASTPLLESVSVRLANRFGFDYGHVRLCASSAFVAGNVLSGVLVAQFGIWVIAPWLLASAALGVISVYLLPPPPKRAAHDFRLELRTTLGQARELLRSRVFVFFLAAASFDQGSHAFYYGYGGLHWRALGLSGTLIGILWPLGVFAEIALFSRSRSVVARLGATRLLMLGAVGCVARWTILAFDPPLPLIVLAQLLHALTFATAHLGAMYFILKAVPPRLAATAQSLYAVFSSGLALGLATLACGPVYAVAGGRTYLLMALMGGCAVLFAGWLAQHWHGGRITTGVSEEEIDTI